MEVLLVRPITRKELVINLMPPIGLGYLATALRKQNIDVDILDCIKENYNYADFRKYIRQKKPRIVGFTVFSHDVLSVNILSRIVKEEDPSVILIVGGPHPSGTYAESLRQMPDVSFAFVGESETSLPEFVRLVERGCIEKESMALVPGLIWKCNGEIYVNPSRYIENLDILDLPAWDLISPLNYPNAPQGIFFKKIPVAPIITSRGCPFECTFCAAHTINGKKIRRRSIENIVKEINMLKENYGVREFHILDDNFTASKQYVMDFCEEIIEKKLNISWCCPNGVRIDTLDTEMLSLMEKSGCYYISVGIESGSQQVLDRMKKKLTLEIIEKQIGLIRKNKLPVNGFFIIGYPGETERDIRKTIRLSLKLKLERAAFYNFLPLPGTEIWQELSIKGKTKSIDMKKMFEAFIPYVPENISAKKLKYYQKIGYLIFYIRPSTLFRMMIKIKKKDQLKFLLNRIYVYILKKNL